MTNVTNREGEAELQCKLPLAGRGSLFSKKVHTNMQHVHSHFIPPNGSTELKGLNADRVHT